MGSNEKGAEHIIPISDILSLRLYSDTRPHRHNISELQKGLILVYKGTELVGEGTGFGVPVVRYRNRTYFSSSSTLQVLQKGDCTTALKQFNLDTIYELRFRKTRIENRTARMLARRLYELYEKNKRSRPMMQQSFINRLGIRDKFVQAKPAGNITVTYTIDDSNIHVRADATLSHTSDLQKVCIMNEQSSRTFKKYYDSEDTVLFNKQIGAWDCVEADWACISSESGEVGFRLWKVQGATLWRGREFVDGALDWVGLEYELGPENTRFEYDIEILEGAKHR